MNRYIWFLLAVFLTFSAGVYAKSEDVQKAIEKRQQDCIEKDSSTAGMCNCADKAYEEWDRELNKAYKKLMKQLPEKDQKTLKESQRAWLKYRDSEFENAANVYNKLEGTMWLPMRIEARTRIVRERTMQLYDYLELLVDNAK